MTSGFTATFPSWLVQPSALQNVFSNQFAPLKDVAAAVQVPDFTLFMNHLKQALYWRRRLASSASANTVIFSFLGIRGLTLPNVLEVCQALKNICNMTKLVEVYRAPNSPFIGISFNSSVEASKFQALCLSYNNSLVLHVTASTSLTHQFKLLWLPPLFPDTRIHHFLSKHSAQHNFIRDHIATDINVNTPSNSVSGTLQLSEHQDINAIPHLIPLPAPHLGSALFILSGRPSLCLKCGLLGHIRRFCTSPKCTVCHRFHLTTVSCSSHNITTDSSILNSWSPEENVIISQPSKALTIMDSSTECDRTCESSFLAVSSPLINPIISADFVSPISPSHNTTSLSADPVLHSILPVHDPDPTAFIKTQEKRPSSSAKRSRPASISSASFSPIHDLAHSNIYSHLVDEANLNTLDTTSHKPGSFTCISSDSSALAFSASPIITQVITENDQLEASGFSSTTSSLHKRPKLHVSSCTSNTSSSPQSYVPAPIAPENSWGDRMDGKAVAPAIPMSTLLPDSFPPLESKVIAITDSAINEQSSSFIPSISASPAITSAFLSSPASDSLVLEHTALNSLDPVDKHSLESDDCEHDTDIIISLTGYPPDASVSPLYEFAGEPKPYAIYLDGDFCSHLLMYRSIEEVQSILEKDGQWIGNNIISISIQESSPDSD